MEAQTLREVAGFLDVPVYDLQDLSNEQQLYLIESFIMVKDPTLRMEVPLIPNRMQEDIFLTSQPREITVKWRRAGLTSAYCARGWVKVLTSPNINVELFAHDDFTARAIFNEVILTQYQNIPDQIRPEADTYNVNTLRFGSLGSSFSVKTVGQSQRTAETKGQARTIHFLICTEFAFYAYAEDFFKKITNCVPDNGTILLDSTPNGRNSFYHRFKGSMEGRGSYKARFYPWWWGAPCRLDLHKGEVVEPTDEELALGIGNPYANEVYGEDKLTPEQIKWRRTKLANLQPKGSLTVRDVFVEEFPEDPDTCFLASGRPVFLHTYCKKTTEPMTHPENGHQYTIGHDASTGDASGHPCGMSVVDITEGKQVYSSREWIPVEVQADKLLTLQAHWNNAHLIVERNFPGDAVIALLRERGVQHFYYHKDREMRENMNKVSKRKPGFPMSSITKPRVFAELEHALSTNDLSLCCNNTIAELGSFQYDDNDTIVFTEGLDTKSATGQSSHGDLVVALALAWHARKSAGVTIA